MSGLQEKVEQAIIETLMNREDGAGSDLNFCRPVLGGEWLHLEGNLDVAHLASEVILVITGEC